MLFSSWEIIIAAPPVSIFSGNERQKVYPYIKLLCPCFFTGVDNESKKFYGVQFHPEVDLTKNGMQMFKNFLFKVS